MPYSLQGSCVYKGDKELKCFDNHDDALAYFRALKLNVENSIQEFSMFISKSSLNDGEMRWSAVNSDTDWDLYGERMSMELYKSMISKIKSNVPPPEPFAELVTSNYWQGGMPYLSIAHYSDGNGKAVPGDVKALFIDGNQLKARGTLHNTPLGQAVWKSLKEDEINYKNLVDTDRIRISIAFLDLAHKHGEDGQTFRRKSFSDACPECLKGVGEKIYLDGYLVHLALTRVPVNPRTIMEAEDVMAKRARPATKKEDAISILGDSALAEEVASSALETKSDILVEMSEAEETPEVDKGMGTEMPEGDSALPYGGATSIKQAREYEKAQAESWRVSDLYYAFSAIAENIMYTGEIIDKAAALSALVDEFKKSLVAKSLYEELSQGGEENYIMLKKDELSKLVGDVVVAELSKAKKNDGDGQDVENPEEDKEEKMPKKSEATAPVEKSALEVSWDNLYNSVTSVVSKAGTADSKLAEIQPKLEELGQAIVAVVRGASDSAPVTPAPVGNDAVLEAIQALASKVEGVVTEVATMKAQSNNVPQESRVPAPRSISPNIVKSDIPSNTANPNSVANIIRRGANLPLVDR